MLGFSSRIKTFFLSVAQASPCQGHDHQRRYPEADHEVRDAPGHGGGGKETVDGRGGRVDGPVRQDSEKHAAFGVVENPREDDGYRHGPDDEQSDIEEAAVRRVPTRDEEQGQVPQGPENSQEEAPDQRPVQQLQPRQRKPAPPYLLKYRSSGKKKDGGSHHVQEQRGWHSRRFERG